MNQAMSTDKKRHAAELNGKEYYLQCIQDAPGVAHLLSKAELSTDIKYASDWSYSASSYASPYLRIVGDAGAFIDPYFSSGVHLALSGALSAAVTICASMKGDADEKTCYEWHSKGVTERYTRFLLVVLGATKQIRSKDAPVMNKAGDDGFDDAFSIIRPGMSSSEHRNHPRNRLTYASHSRPSRRRRRHDLRNRCSQSCRLHLQSR